MKRFKVWSSWCTSRRSYVFNWEACIRTYMKEEQTAESRAGRKNKVFGRRRIKRNRGMMVDQEWAEGPVA